MLKTITDAQYTTSCIVAEVVGLSTKAIFMNKDTRPVVLEELRDLSARMKKDKDPGYVIADAMIEAIYKNHEDD